MKNYIVELVYTYSIEAENEDEAEFFATVQHEDDIKHGKNNPYAEVGEFNTEESEE